MEQFKYEYDCVIIDPASTEFNRGSFCYLPYILYAALANTSFEVFMAEDFTLAQLDKLPTAKKYLVALWSYPQIETCVALERFIDGNVEFFGYYPLIDQHKLPKYIVQEKTLLEGLNTYPDHFTFFENILLSDCDMHLKKYEGQVYPLFTSYGCPSGCSFCPTTVNCDKKRLVCDLEDVKHNLAEMQSIEQNLIHFTDEDFFFDIDRTHEIFKWCAERNWQFPEEAFKFIALGSVYNVLRYIRKYGQEVMQTAGLKLIEIGLETADADLAKRMGKPAVEVYRELASLCEIEILWLTLTFFPGETITTLNETGKFLAEHGLDRNKLYGRIQTNGTQGGLGQFFQPYVGTPGYKNIQEEGLVLTSRPIRLIPSFIPDSFLECVVKRVRLVTDEDHEWIKLYNLPLGIVVRQDFTVEQIINENSHKYKPEQVAVLLAVMARLGIIEEA